VVERLLEDEQPVVGTEPGEHLVPGVVGVRGADHDLQPRVHLPQRFDGLRAIPTGGHAHVDEGKGIRAVGVQAGAQRCQTLLPLVSRVDFEGG
jgi:hypothetical protein